jgi:lipoprotein-releasing system permease protein
MGPILFILRKYWWPERGGLVGFGVWISVVGVALSVALLMVVLAIMSGFTEIFQRNYTRIESDIVVAPYSSAEISGEIASALNAEAAVQAFTPIKLSQGMVLKNGVGGVVLEGVDWKTTGQVTPWNELWVEKPKDYGKPFPQEAHWIWLGEPLAKKLRVHAGDWVDVLITDGRARRVIPFLVTGISKLGMYDHDMRFARMDLQVLDDLFRKYGLEPRYKVKLKKGADINVVAKRLAGRLKGRATVKKWSELHVTVLQAVEHQKKMLYLILQILVGLAAMNVVSLLLVTAHLRRKELAVMRAMGMRAHQLFELFILQGLGVGVIGVGVGMALGGAVCFLFQNFQPSFLSESVYNVTRLPLDVRPWDLVWISCGGLIISVLFSAIPAWSLIRQQPLEVLKQE